MGPPESLENSLYFQFIPFDPKNDSIFLEAIYLILKLYPVCPCFPFLLFDGAFCLPVGRGCEGFCKGQLCAPCKMNLKTFTLRFELDGGISVLWALGKNMLITMKNTSKNWTFSIKKKLEKWHVF